MKRREFLKSALAATALGTATASVGAAASTARVGSTFAAARDGTAGTGGARQSFRLDYAPHFGMFSASAGDDLMDQLRFMDEHGFRSLEDNGMRDRPVADQERIASEMARLDMRMGVFVAHTIYWREPNLASGDADRRQEFLDEIRGSIEVARRVNATWMTVVPGHVAPRLHPDFQTAHVVETLRRAAELLEPHGLVMVLEPLNPRDHPGLFLTGIPQAYQICRAVDSPACKILDDLYHQQVTEGNLIPNLDAAWSEIAYFQIGDNPGRREPTTGEINYANVFRHILERGYDGILGMEHGNSRSGPEGERAVIEAYRGVDPA
jgi:hydroxypyruvate isomerase